MKNKMIARTMIAVMLAASLPAIAQDRGYRDDRAQQERRDDRFQQERREERRDMRNEQRDENRDARREYRDNQRDARRDYRDARRDYRDDRRNDRGDYRHGNRGAGPRHDLYSGQRLPSNYQNRQYVVDNWRSHRLSAPPRGHHWVQVGNDYVLAAIATGVIASIFLGN